MSARPLARAITLPNAIASAPIAGDVVGHWGAAAASPPRTGAGAVTELALELDEEEG